MGSHTFSWMKQWQSLNCSCNSMSHSEEKHYRKPDQLTQFKQLKYPNRNSIKLNIFKKKKKILPSILIPGKNKKTNPSRLTLPPTKTVKSDSSAPYTIENYIPVHFNSMILIRPFVISDAKISSLPLKSLTLIFNNHIYSPHIPSHSQVKWKTSLLMAKNHTFFLLIVIKDFFCLFV